MGLLDRFLDAIKLNDDDEDFFDDDFEEEVEEKPKSRFFKGFDDDDEDFFDDEEDDIPVKKKPSVRKSSSTKDTLSYGRAPKKEKPAKKSKITPMKKGRSVSPMEVNVIRPESMEDTKDIADTLLDKCTVVLNLEGLDVDNAQRIIDFTCGACYSLGGALQKISGYIYIITPESVDISGDYEELLNGTFDLPSMKSRY
ncbi:MAG: cell division protein SepF [Lachnospiraceae bacterium]|nr:cell division protein SepF [Candidatus Equihabitans merdae]